MGDDPMPILSAAMREWVRPFAINSKPFRLTDNRTQRIRAMREKIRAEEGGGGMCHMVTEWLAEAFGLERLSVTYLAPNGEVAVSGHLVSLLEDGSLFDPTADQLGEGHDLRILVPDDPEYGRYRPEFTGDYHPGHPDIDDGSLDAWLPFYGGEQDMDIETLLTSERGTGWWLGDKSLLLDYFRTQQGYANDRHYADWLTQRITELEAGLTSTLSL